MPYAKAENERAFRRKQSRLRKEAGKCVSCRNAATRGVRCESCAQRNAENTNRKAREDRAANRRGGQ